MAGNHPDDGEIDLDAEYRARSARQSETESFGYDLDSLDGDPHPPAPPQRSPPDGPSHGRSPAVSDGSIELDSLDGSQPPPLPRPTLLGTKAPAKDPGRAPAASDGSIELDSIEDYRPAPGGQAAAPPRTPPRAPGKPTPARESAAELGAIDLDLDFSKGRATRASSVSEDYGLESVDEHVLRQEQARGRARVEDAEAAIDIDEVYRELEQTGDFETAFEGMKLRFSLRTLVVAAAAVLAVIVIGQSGLLDGLSFASFVVAAILGLAGTHAVLNIQERRRIKAILHRREFEVRKARFLAGLADSPVERSDFDHPEEPIYGVLSPFDLLRTQPPVTPSEIVGSVGLAALATVLVFNAGSLTQTSAGIGATVITGFAVQVAELETPRFALIAWWFALAGFAAVLLVKIVMLPFGDL